MSITLRPGQNIVINCIDDSACNSLVYINVGGKVTAVKNYCWNLVSKLDTYWGRLGNEAAEYGKHICVDDENDIYIGQINRNYCAIISPLNEMQGTWLMHRFLPDQVIMNFLKERGAWRND